MTKQRHISVSFSIGILLLLTSSSPLSTVAEGDDGGGRSEWKDDGRVSLEENTPVTWKYNFQWSKSAHKSSEYYVIHVQFDIESVNCTIDANCTSVLPGLEHALEYESDIPSSPYCDVPDDAENASKPAYDSYKCTCGKDLCVSRSRDSTTNELFYYCGPCGFVGSQCTPQCDHELAECRDGYCECIQEGTYYDMSKCYIPFYGQEILINILIASCILLLCCATLAYGYHKLGNRRLRQSSFYNERGSSIGRRESPSDDTPPAYDDVIEKLPSYQDAIQMIEKDDAERGLNNPAFEVDESGAQKSRKDQAWTTTTVATQHGDAEGQNNAVSEEDMTNLPSYEDTTITAPTMSLASLPSTGVSPSASVTQDGDIASFPERPLREGSVSELTVRDEQRGLGTQPIELLLHSTLHTQHTTTSL